MDGAAVLPLATYNDCDTGPTEPVDQARRANSDALVKSRAAALAQAALKSSVVRKRIVSM
jgi:hypothetical protein